MRSVQISKFKATCLELLETVQRTGEPLTITRRGQPVAVVYPAPAQSGRKFGCMQGSLTIHGDVIEPLNISWEAAAD